MKEDLKYLFDYCKIPEDGQRYILKSPEDNQRMILDAYKASPYRAKYSYFPLLVTRFIYDEGGNLYHYLDHRNLEKILKSRIYFAGYQYEMNDSTEGTYSWDCAYKILKTMNPSSALTKMFEYEKNIHPYDYYLISFSKSDFNQALQLYGDVAIEVNSNKLQKALIKKYIPRNFNGIQSMQEGNAYSFAVNVVYDEKIQQDCIKNTLNIWKTAWKLHQEEIFNYASMTLHFYSLVFKPWKYHQEEEVRFLISKIINDESQSYERIVNNKRKIEIPINENIVTSVIVNHTADKIEGENINLVESKVKRMLKENSFNNTTVRKTVLEY